MPAAAPPPNRHSTVPCHNPRLRLVDIVSPLSTMLAELLWLPHSRRSPPLGPCSVRRTMCACAP
eukprot:3779534-Prymnesium_polylepis.1